MAGQTGKLEVNLLQGVKLRDTQTFGELVRLLPGGPACCTARQGAPRMLLLCPHAVVVSISLLVMQASKTHMLCSR